MLESYFELDALPGEEGIKKHKRLLAVQAAMEIVKASAMSSDASSQSRVDDDLRYAATNLELLVDAIQTVLEK
ncbi:hypothetical protein [Serratia nematodiphila]|uniref:hypothetical protein n=1 Tax=Serratia nematodiphila TaxID=458197 RepID=UPI0011DAB374|nr:hypothetical protein [Serratia nematodiphila]TXE64565.1 hypothetical protein FOT58_09480 [Serratia nematodiphila]